MKTNTVVTGMVLQVMPIGEHDKRVTLLTKEKGKISAFAQGARKPGNALMAATEPFACGEFTLYEGRRTYRICGVSVYHYFRELANDYDAACCGFYFLELAGYFSVENDNGKDMLNLLYASFKALEKESFDRRLVRVIFEMRCLFLNGTYPNVYECVDCGGKEHLRQFDVHKAGLRCIKCTQKTGENEAALLEEATVYAMQYILSAPTEKLYTFRVSARVLSELERIVRDFYRRYIGRQFKSQAFLR